MRTSPSVSPSVFGSSATTCGGPGQRAGEVGDLLVGDRADRAQRLRDDQVGLQARERVAVELVDRFALERALAHGRVDLGCVEARGEPVAGELGESSARPAGGRTRG